MKQITAVLAVSVALLTSCAKQENTVPKQSTLEQLETLAANNARKELGFQLKKKGPHVGRTLAGDAVGAATGMFLGPFGAFCGAVTASVCYAFGEGNYKTTNSPNSNNGQNPFDMYGPMHNEGSRHLLNNLQHCTSDGALNHVAAVRILRDYGVATYPTIFANAQPYNEAALADILGTIKQFQDIEDPFIAIPEMITALQAKSYLTTEESDLLRTYLLGFLNAEDPIQYSVDAENIFVNSGISANSKAKLLNAASVARNSSQLWSE